MPGCWGRVRGGMFDGGWFQTLEERLETHKEENIQGANFVVNIYH